MATLERPLKEGNVRTYQQKVALGFPDILASEADADLDTIYGAWNAGIGTAQLLDQSVTEPKLGGFAVSSRTLGDSQVTEPKLATFAVSTRALGDSQVTTPKLATGAAVAGVWSGINGTTHVVSALENSVTVTVPSYRGGSALVLAEVMGYVVLTNTTESRFSAQVQWNADVLPGHIVVATGPGGALSMPWTISIVRVYTAVTGSAVVVVKAQPGIGQGTWAMTVASLTVVGLA